MLRLGNKYLHKISHLSLVKSSSDWNAETHAKISAAIYAKMENINK